MRITTTAILAGIALVLSGVIHLINREPAQRGDKAGNLMTRFESEAVETIVIKKSDGTVSLQKSESGEWNFVEPVTDRVSSRAVATLLDQLNHLAILDRIDRKEIGGADEISAGDMGLDASRLIRVEISGDGGDDLKPVEEVLLIGTEAGIDNAIYARFPDTGEKATDGGVFVVDGNPRSFLTDPVKAMRDRRLVKQSTDRLVKVVVKTGQGEIEIQRKITPPMYSWTVLKPIQALANIKLMESLAAGLGAIEVIDVLEDGAPSEIPNPVPDDSIAMDLRFYGDDVAGEATRLFLKPHYDGGKAMQTDDGQPILEATISDRPARFLVTSDLLDLMPQSANSFRDLHILRLNPQTLQRIFIQSRTQAPVDLRSTPTPDGLVWGVVINGELKPANQDAVNAMIESINETEVIDFVTDSQARLGEFGLAPPATQVRFQNYVLEGQDPEAAVKILQLGRTAGDETKLYANLASRPNIFEVPPVLQTAIPTHISNWKSRQVFNFTEYSLKEITRIRPDDADSSEVQMKYDLSSDSWTVMENGKDVSKQLNPAVAKTLRTRLGSLRATSWAVSLSDGYLALSNDPVLEFKIKVSEIDDKNEETIVERSVKLAPTAGNALYYGQVGGSPDVFYLDRKTFEELNAPLFRPSITPE